MPSRWHVARAAITASGEQQARSASGPCGSSQSRRVTPIAFWPARSSATALSTPPLIATATRPGAGSARQTCPSAFARASTASSSPPTAAASSSVSPASGRSRPSASALTTRSPSTARRTIAQRPSRVESPTTSTIGPRLPSLGPGLGREDQPVAVGIDEGDGAVPLPVRVRGRPRLEPVSAQARDCRLELIDGAEVEDELVLRGRRGLLAVVRDVLELPRGVRQPEDDAAVAVVVVEGRDDRQPERLAVEAPRGFEVARRAGNANLHPVSFALNGETGDRSPPSRLQPADAPRPVVNLDKPGGCRVFLGLCRSRTTAPSHSVLVLQRGPEHVQARVTTL